MAWTVQGFAKRQIQLIQAINQLVQASDSSLVKVEANAWPQKTLFVAGFRSVDGSFIDQIVKFSVQLLHGLWRNGHIQKKFHPVSPEFRRMKNAIEAADVSHGFMGAVGEKQE